MQIVVVLLTTVLLISYGVQAKDVGERVTFCYEEKSYPPYINVEADALLGNSGILVDMVKQATAELSIPVRFIRRPWLRCQKLVVEGRAQGLFAMIKTPERQTQYAFPPNNDSAIFVDYPIFYPNNKTYQEKLAAFERAPAQFNAKTFDVVYGIAAPLGYVAYHKLAKLGLKSFEDYNVVQGLKLAANQRLDGYVVERRIGRQQLTILGLEEKVLITRASLVNDYWHVAFNLSFYQQHASLIDDFWLALARAKTDQLSKL